MESTGLDDALETLGALLAERGQKIELLIGGGACLLLLGIVERPTADVDVIGFKSGHHYRKADKLPDFLVQAVREVGDALGLGDDWLNNGPAELAEWSLPDGIEDRVTIRSYGGLGVHMPAPEDMICFKLYAAVDRGERDKHFRDLVLMKPTANQLIRAARWSQSQDPSAGFRRELLRTLALFGVEVTDADL